MNDQELIWVDKKFAEEYNVLKSEKDQRDRQVEVFKEYMQSISEASKKEYRANFEDLEESLAIYNGLMLQVKQSFEKAKNEQLDASYKLWEKFEHDLPKTEKKVDNIIAVLNPLTVKLKELNDLIAQIRTWDIDQLAKSIEHLATLYGKNKTMVEFLVGNFHREESK